MSATGRVLTPVGHVLISGAYDKPNCPLGRVWLYPPGARHLALGSAGCWAKSLARRPPAPTTAAKRPGGRWFDQRSSYQRVLSGSPPTLSRARPVRRWRAVLSRN